MAHLHNTGGVADAAHDTHDTLLEDLLAKWELACQDGVELTAEQVAIDHP